MSGEPGLSILETAIDLMFDMAAMFEPAPDQQALVTTHDGSGT